MKTKTIYIADDGTRFETKAECVTYEKKGAEAIARKDKMRSIKAERQTQEDIKQNALTWMQIMKSGNIKPWQVEPTINNVINCRANLSRIEAIYKNAKKEFFKDINTPNLSLKERANRICHSARVLDIAIDKRNEILERWVECKKDVASANKRLAELDKEKAELLNKEKNNE